jgi:hypothetical protein
VSHFIELTDTDGQKFFVNVAHIIVFRQWAGKTLVETGTFAPRYVQESLDTIAAMLVVSRPTSEKAAQL